MARKRKLKHGTRVRVKTHVSTAPLPWNGDHGTATAAATAGTVLVPMGGPNRMARRYRVSIIDTMEARLSMRQVQAARAIQEAYCRAEMLSSGGPLKEQVDASPKPDAAVASQVDAMSTLTYVMSAVPSAMRDVVEWVCWHNMPIHRLTGSGRKQYNRTADFKVAMDLVANRLRY